MNTLTTLDQLRTMTTVVADTGDLSAIRRLKPVDATTNPSLITAAAQLTDNAPLILAAFRRAQREGLTDEARLNRVIDLLTVDLGIQILGMIEGRVSTEVDAHLSHDTAATLSKARELMALYEAAGIARERVLIKIAATWEGIAAAKQLEAEGIHCNVTLIFGLHQAIACAEAGVTLISPFVGRILDWYKKDEGRDSYPVNQDPGVRSVKRIYAYFKQHGYKTQVMGASFRSSAQIMALAGCDLLTISPSLLDELQQSTAPLTRQLFPDADKQSLQQEKMTLNQADFATMHVADRMSSQLLEAGIKGFVEAREQLAAFLYSFKS